MIFFTDKFFPPRAWWICTRWQWRGRWGGARKGWRRLPQKSRLTQFQGNTFSTTPDSLGQGDARGAGYRLNSPSIIIFSSYLCCVQNVVLLHARDNLFRDKFSIREAANNLQHANCGNNIGTMVLLLDGNPDHVAHAWGEIELLGGVRFVTPLDPTEYHKMIK